MAAATTALGTIPLLADVFFRAMAVTIIGGLRFATVLTMVVVPVLFSVFYRGEARQGSEEPRESEITKEFQNKRFCALGRGRQYLHLIEPTPCSERKRRRRLRDSLG